MISNLQDLIRVVTKYAKYWKLSVLLFCIAALAALTLLVYGSPIYYSNSEIEYQFVDLPIRSETSDLGERNTRYNNIQFVLQTGLSSAWLKERTALKLGLIKSVAEFDDVTSKILPNLKVTQFVGNLIRLEVWTYRPELARFWPQAMLEEYHSFLTEQRTKRREQLVASFSEEMERIRGKILEEQANEQNFEAENKILEKYIGQNRLEQLPSELLTIRTRVDAMTEMEKYMAETATSTVEKLALYKKYRTMPLPVGTLVRIGQKDRMMVKRTAPTSIPGSASGEGLSDANSTSNLPSNQSQAQVIVVPETSQSPEAWEEISEELRKAQEERDRASLRLLPAHQEMRVLNGRVEELNASLSKELGRNEQAFQLEKAYLVDQLQQLESSLPEYRKLVSDYDTYKRDFSLLSSGKLAWEQAYSTLKQKLAAMDYTGAEPRVNFKFNGFLEVRDDLPVAPNKQKLLTYALALGFGLAFGVPFGIDRLRFTTSIVAEAETVSGLRALGVVPHIGNIQQKPASQISELAAFWPNRQVQECFRLIRSQILLQRKDDFPAKVLMTVSCRESEGKSTVSTFTAAAFSSSNSRTLLIDADLRRGRLDRRLGLPIGIPGLADLLHFTNKDCSEVIYQLLPNFDVIPRGDVSYAVEDSLSNERLPEVMAILRQKYDTIIVDTTPILGLADPLDIRRVVDGVVLVIRAESTTHRDMIAVKELFERGSVPLVGFVLNDVDMDKMENNYYYNSYYPKYYDRYYTDSGKPESSTDRNK
jgi:capsular exopolysaccharide synthesis family protein